MRPSEAEAACAAALGCISYLKGPTDDSETYSPPLSLHERSSTNFGWEMNTYTTSFGRTKLCQKPATDAVPGYWMFILLMTEYAN